VPVSGQPPSPQINAFPEELYDMSAEAHAGLGPKLGQMRQSFRGWRGQRPFWGGLLSILGGLPIMYFPYANLAIGNMTIKMATTAGAGSLIIGILLVVLGLTMWFQPHSRVFAGVAAILLALVSLVVSNFGGFVIGFLLALVGAASVFPGHPRSSRTTRPGRAVTTPRPPRTRRRSCRRLREPPIRSRA